MKAEVIAGDSPDVLEERLNARLARLRDNEIHEIKYSMGSKAEEDGASTLYYSVLLLLKGK